MNRINLRAVPEVELRSPSGKFHSFCRNLSLALGGLRNTGTWGGGHPFDLQIRRIPPGAAVCPFHSHLNQWELFVIRAGRGTVRAGKKSHPVRAGDVFMHPPGEPHQLSNTGQADLEVLIIADNQTLDACHYPDSGKWGLRPPAKTFRMIECDYFDGEDEVERLAPKPLGRVGGNASHPVYRPPPASLPKPATPFARRRVNLADLKWEHWKSPGGRFSQSGKGPSDAIGDVRSGWPRRGHPFNLELVRVPAGKSACPFHWHAAQWELFWILEGTATIRAGKKRFQAKPGDIVMHPPFEPHELVNPGRKPVLFYIVADTPPVDYSRYPDSDKWGLRAPRKIFRMTGVDYHDGEE